MKIMCADGAIASISIAQGAHFSYIIHNHNLTLRKRKSLIILFNKSISFDLVFVTPKKKTEIKLFISGFPLK